MGINLDEFDEEIKGRKQKEVTYPVDFLGNRIRVGDIVAKADSAGRSAVLSTRKVTKIEGKSVWLVTTEDGRPTKAHYNSRFVVIA